MRFLGSERNCVSWLAWAASEGWLKIEILVLRVTQLSSNGDAPVVPLNGVIFLPEIDLPVKRIQFSLWKSRFKAARERIRAVNEVLGLISCSSARLIDEVSP